MTIKIEPVIRCDGCGKIIENAKDGFIIIGGIFVAEVNKDGQPTGGLIGPPFFEKGKRADQVIPSEENINKKVFCTECLLDTLGIKMRRPEEPKEYLE